MVGPVAQHRARRSLAAVQPDSPLEGHSLWDLALITPGLARSHLFYFAAQLEDACKMVTKAAARRHYAGH